MLWVAQGFLWPSMVCLVALLNEKAAEKNMS